MSNVLLCLNDKIENSNNKLQPTIFKAILNLFKKGFLQITARMVKEECIKIDTNIDWNNRLKAICNSMRNSIECGGRIVGEDRDFNDFTIAFDGLDNNLYKSKSNANPNVPIVELIAKNKKPIKSKNNQTAADKKINDLLKSLDWEKLKNKEIPKLLIIGCCDAKSYQPNNLPNGANVNYNFGDSLIKLRKSRLEFYKELPDSYFNKKKRNRKLANKSYFMDSLNENNRREVLDVYGSNRSPFYNPDMKKLYKDKIKNNNLHLLIISGLYGVIKHDDYINDYHLEIGRGGEKWTGSLIQEVVKNYISGNKIPNTNVFYCLSENYLPFLKPIPKWENLWLNHNGYGDNQANDLKVFLSIL